MKVDEAKLLESLSRVIGAEDILEEKRDRWAWEQAVLERLSGGLGVPLPEPEPELPLTEETVLEGLPEAVPEASQEAQDPIVPEVVLPTTQPEQGPQELPEDLQDLPQVPAKDLVTQTVVALSKAPQSSVQQVADQIPDSFRKELDILKKSILDLHRFAQRQSQMGGGGEVNLRWLDDVDRPAIADGQYLRYDAATKKFTFDSTAYISCYYAGANVALSSTTTAYTVPPGSLYNSSSKKISLGANNDIVIGHTSRYVLNFSIQYSNNDNVENDIYVWMRMNGADVADSSSVFTIPARKSAGTTGKLIAVTPLFFTANSGDVVQIMTAVPDSAMVSIVTLPTGTTPTTPRAPGTIMTITEIL